MRSILTMVLGSMLVVVGWGIGPVAAWGQGATLPPHVERTSGGDCRPAPGYAWETKLPGNFRVRWKPGLPHRDYAHVFAATKEGSWASAAGYTWLSATTTDLRVRWNPGAPHPRFSHVVVSSKEGIWSAAPGYRFANDTPGDFSVVPAFRQPDQDAVARAIAKVLAAAVADAASQPDDNDGFLTTILRQAVHEGRDQLIESAVEDLFPDLNASERRAVRRVICLGLDGQVSERNWRTATAKEDLIARLRREDPNLADAAVVADFICKVMDSRQR